MTNTATNHRKHIHHLCISLLLLILLAVYSTSLIPTSFAVNDSDVILVGVHANFPPQYSIDENTGEPAGFAIDVMDEIARNSGLNIRYVVFDTWPEMNQAMKDGVIDVQANVGIAPERTEYLDFTTPVETFHISIIVRSSTTDINDIDDLQGRKVAAVKDNLGLTIMQEYEKADLIIFDSLDKAFLSLISGTTDALVYPEPIILQIARNSGLEDHIKVVGSPLLEVKRAIGVGKNKTELFNTLDAEVKLFIASPEYSEIYAKWYGESEPYWNVQRIMLYFGIVFLLVLGLVIGGHYFSILKFNRKLSTSIAEKELIEEKLEGKERLLTETQHISKVGGWEYIIETEQMIWTDETYHIHEIPLDTEIDHVSESVKCYRPEDRAIILGAFQKAIEKGISYDMEFLFTTFKNNQLWIRTTATPVLDENGKVVRLIGNIVDITERKQVEEEIRKLNEDLEGRVEERTAELEEKNAELERMNKLFVGRELRMIELKEQIKELQAEIENKKKWQDKS